MAPTIQDYFGQDATIDTTDENNPALVIPFSSLAVAGLSNVENFDNPEVIFAGIVKLVSLYTRNDTSEETRVELRAPTPGMATRAGVLRQLFTYTMEFYGGVITETELDPDNLA